MPSNYVRIVPVCVHRRLHQCPRRGLSTTLYLAAPLTSRSRQDSVLVFLVTFVFCPTVVHSFRQRRTYLRFCCPHTRSFAPPPLHSLDYAPAAESSTKIAIIAAASQYLRPVHLRRRYHQALSPPSSSTLTVLRTVSFHVRLD
jgi:hypothetical protein